MILHPVSQTPSHLPFPLIAGGTLGHKYRYSPMLNHTYCKSQGLGERLPAFNIFLNIASDKLKVGRQGIKGLFTYVSWKILQKLKGLD